jgi:hypothetical protein
MKTINKTIPAEILNQLLSSPKIDNQLLSNPWSADLRVLQQWYKKIPQIKLFVQHTISFDRDPHFIAVTDGSPLDIQDTYTSWGVSFSGQGVAAGKHVYARSIANGSSGTGTPASFSAPNVISLTPPNSSIVDSYYLGINELYGKIRASFENKVMYVSIQAAARSPLEYLAPVSTFAGRMPYLEAFDENGRSIQRVELPISYFPPDQGGLGCCMGPYGKLEISSRSANIAYVEFSCAYKANDEYLEGYFDDMVFKAPLVLKL